jgi:hypothetical protein
MGFWDFLHPQGARDTKRDDLLKDVTGQGDNLHWGKQGFTAAEYAKFVQNMQGIEMSSKQLDVLRAVHDGKPVPGTGELVSPDHTTTQQLMAKSTIDKDGNLHIGKLTVDKPLVEDFTKVMKEGVPDPEFAAMMEKASKDGCHIKQDLGANSRASSAEKTIWWDSKHVATDYHNEASMSARDVLKHETSHELRDPEITRVLVGIPDGTKTNREEQAAIEAEHRHMPGYQYQRDSHEANTVKTQDDPNLAPQVCKMPEIAVSVTDVTDGKPGSPVYKSSGQLTGTVQGIKVEHETNPDGTLKVNGAATEVITLQDARGKLQEVRFNANQFKDVDVEGNYHDHPVKTLTDGVKVGDDIALKFEPRQQTATLENHTQGYNKVVDPLANQVGGASVDYSAQTKESVTPGR